MDLGSPPAKGASLEDLYSSCSYFLLSECTNFRETKMLLTTLLETEQTPRRVRSSM